MDIVFISILIAITLGSYIYVEVKYKKYRNEDLKKLKSGFEISREILDNHNLNNIYITESRESLFSQYDPDRKVVRLVKGVFNDTSITSCAISAMTSSYAVLDKKKDKWYLFRTKFDKFISFILYGGYMITMIGIVFGHINTILTGVALEYVVLLYYFSTYSVEKSAEKIALDELVNSKNITKKELFKIKELLKANSLLYFASIVFPIAWLFKFIVDFGDINKK
jgi:Zn-dependent membrane protease YugP